MKADAIVTKESNKSMNPLDLCDEFDKKIAQVMGMLYLIPLYKDTNCAREALSGTAWACRDLLDDCKKLNEALFRLAIDGHKRSQGDKRHG